MNKYREALEMYANIIEKHAITTPLKCVPPDELHLELTFKCNAQCVMCNVRYVEPKIAELSLIELKQHIQRSVLLKDMRFIVLSGGEAWLRKDFIDIVIFLREHSPNAHLLILSNLSDTELAVRNIERIKSTVGLGNISIGSSLDGIGAAHDRMRGRKGSFESLERTLGRLSSEYAGLYFSLNFTLTPENVDQMRPAFQWCRERNYHLSFQLMVQKKETRQFAWTTEHCAAVDEHVDAMVEELIREHGLEKGTMPKLLANGGLLSLLLNWHYIPKYLKDPKRYFPSCPCGEKFAMVDPAGNVYFCPVHKDKIAGNLRESSFDEIWVSDKAASVRKTLNERKCHCWLTCTNTHMIDAALRDGKNASLENIFAV